MTNQELKDLLETSGIKFAYHHWEKPPKMPYGVFFDPYTENFAADNIAYVTIRHFIIELYVRQRDPAIENRLEDVLTGADIYWDKDATYIDPERFFQISYEIEV